MTSIKERTRILPTKVCNQLQSVSVEFTQDIILELWYQYAERLLNRVIDICQLDTDQADALRKRELRPNDFRIVVGYL